MKDDISSNTITPLPADHPLMKAWKAHQASDDYANSKKWAQAIAIEFDPVSGTHMPVVIENQYLEGSLWALFVAGWNARSADETSEPLRELIPVVNDAGQFFGMASPESTDGQDSTWNGPRYVRAPLKASGDCCVKCGCPLPPVQEWSTPACPKCTAQSEEVTR